MGSAGGLKERLHRELQTLSQEIRDLDGSTVPILQHPVDPLNFYRQHVATSRPAIIRGATQDWPALRKWQSTAYLKAAVPERQVTVAMTPNGRADAVTPLNPASCGDQPSMCFALPYEARMLFPDFLDALAAKPAGTVHYAQAQNSSLSEFGALAADLDAELSWATRIFGQPAEVCNIWMGCSRSVTSWHRDHYENIYAVIVGAKRFTLLPPAEAWRLCKRPFPVARWQLSAEGWQLKRQEPPSTVPWCPVDCDTMHHPTPKDYELYAAMFDPSLPKPIAVEVAAGDILYLPAMWNHQVEQIDCGGRVIACNWWFDMHMGSFYALNAFVERVAELSRADETATQGIADTCT